VANEFRSSCFPCRAYHSITAVDLVLGNLRHDLRQRDRNIACYGLLPPGADPRHALDCLIKQVRQLQQGVEMWVMRPDGQLERTWVIGGVGIVTSDFPEGRHISCPS
jgi:hypothetical protein